MTKQQLLFKPTDEEGYYLEKNKISWSDYCHRNLSRDIKNQKYFFLEKIQMQLVLIVMSLLIFLIGVSNIFNQLIVISCYICSIFLFSFSIFSIIGEYKKA